MNESRKILVTGASGYIASQLLPAFRERFDLRLLDVKKTTRDGGEVEDVIIADLANQSLEELGPHFAGIDTVVHLGYIHASGPEIERYEVERTNVDMAYKVYRLALEEGARRVVMASSNHAADWWEHRIRDRSIDVIDPMKTPAHSDNFYGWAKLAYEEMGFIFASGGCRQDPTGGRVLEVVQIRIGAPREIKLENFRPRGDVQGYKRDLGAHISPRDLQQLFVKSIETENIVNEWGIPYQVFYGTSDNARCFWSLANARKVIGYAPEDDAEVKYAEDIAAWLPKEKPGMI